MRSGSTEEEGEVAAAAAAEEEDDFEEEPEPCFASLCDRFPLDFLDDDDDALFFSPLPDAPAFSDVEIVG